MQKKLFAAAILMAIVLGAATVLVGTLATSRVEAGSCKCPMIWDPVICSDGQVYSNACVARCSGAHGCTSTGGGPIQ